MTVTAESLGPNSVALKYSRGETVLNILTSIKDFLTTHGWTAEDATFQSSNNSMVYSCLNKDGVSKKYLRLYASGSSIYSDSMYGYDSTSKTISYPTGSITHLIQGEGVVYLSASSLWFAMQVRYDGNTINNQWAAVTETTSVYPQDVAPTCTQYAFMIASYFVESGNTLFIPRTYQGYNQNQNSCVINVGGWGGRSAKRMSDIINHDLSPFDFKHQAFDVYAVADTASDRMYHKGSLYALKVFSFGVGGLGDIAKVKVDSNWFLNSSSGIEKDYLIFQYSDNVSQITKVGFPA